MAITFGCHGSTFELDYDKGSDRLEHILHVIKESGLKGMDCQVSLLGHFINDPIKLRDLYQELDLIPTSLTVPFTWPLDNLTKEETERALFFINFAKTLSDKTKLNIVPRGGKNRDDVVIRRKQIMHSANEVAKLGFDNGVICSLHPCSPLNSYIRTKEDYDVMFDLIDDRYLGWTPDMGHIFYGGMDVLKTIKDHHTLIKHAHFKDASSGPVWSTLGEGEIPFKEIVSYLVSINYDGWIMMEEETPEAVADPDTTVVRLGHYVNEHYVPLTLK